MYGDLAVAKQLSALCRKASRRASYREDESAAGVRTQLHSHIGRPWQAWQPRDQHLAAALDQVTDSALRLLPSSELTQELFDICCRGVYGFYTSLQFEFDLIQDSRQLLKEAGATSSMADKKIQFSIRDMGQSHRDPSARGLAVPPVRSKDGVARGGGFRVRLGMGNPEALDLDDTRQIGNASVVSVGRFE